MLSFVAQTPAALAQSFDCKKAGTPVEKLICSDKELGGLDAELETNFRAMLNVSLAERAAILAEARRWIGARDKKCPIPKGGAQDAALACLKAEYRARIAALAELARHQAAERPADKGLCQSFADRYKAALAKQATPKAIQESPLDLLTNDPASGVVAGPKADELQDPTPADLESWARRQTPSFKFSPKLTSAIGGPDSGLVTLARAPGTALYSAETVGGTLHCLRDVYFEVKDGVARGAGDLPWGEGEGESCGALRAFGAIDGRTVAFEETDFALQAQLGAGVAILKWDRGFFGAPCNVGFEYEPAFDFGNDENRPDEEVKCESPACQALKTDALALVEMIERGPQKARQAALARLTEPQRAQFAALEELQLTKDAAAAPHGAGTKPLLAPLVHRGTVYLARIGHRTIGWRTFADWSVSLAERGKDGLKPAGWIEIAMKRGKLRDARVR